MRAMRGKVESGLGMLVLKSLGWENATVRLEMLCMRASECTLIVAKWRWGQGAIVLIA